jgi:multiple sugar transport system permease protein
MMESTRKYSLLSRVVTYVILAVFVVVALFPFYWMALTSFRTPRGVYVREKMLMPRELTWQNYHYIFTQRPTLMWLRNSALVGLGSSTLSVAIGILGGYAVARLKFRGNRTVAKAILFTYLIPSSLLFIPLFIVMYSLKLTNSLWGVMLAYQSFNVPFCTWLILGYFRSIPEELEDAALIDGCSKIGVLVRIVLPLAAPGIVTAFIFGFTNSWNEFLYVITLVNSKELLTLPTGLGSFIMGDVFLWGPLMATALITTIPPIILFMFVQRYVVSGMTLGSVKG